MTIQINSDKNISAEVKLQEKLRKTISRKLARYREFITRVEVFLGDENSYKRGVTDKRCVLEVRMEGFRPIAVTNYDATVEQSMKGALDKAKAAIDSAIGRLGVY